MDDTCQKNTDKTKRPTRVALFVFVWSPSAAIDSIETLLSRRDLEVDVGEVTRILCLALVSCFSSGPAEVPVPVA